MFRSVELTSYFWRFQEVRDSWTRTHSSKIIFWWVKCKWFRNILTIFPLKHTGISKLMEKVLATHISSFYWNQDVWINIRHSANSNWDGFTCNSAVSDEDTGVCRLRAGSCAWQEHSASRTLCSVPQQPTEILKQTAKFQTQSGKHHEKVTTNWKQKNMRVRSVMIKFWKAVRAGHYKTEYAFLK